MRKTSKRRNPSLSSANYEGKDTPLCRFSLPKTQSQSKPTRMSLRRWTHWPEKGRGGCWPPPWRLEVAEDVARYREARGADGRRLVVRNGRAQPRKVVIGGMAVPVQAPRIDDRREGEKFASQILPAYLRRSQRLDQVLPLLYLRGLSTGDFAPALEELLGEAARGFSVTNIVRLKEYWEAEFHEWRARDFTGTDYVYA